MTLQVLEVSDAEHDAFVRDHPRGHLMQTTAWGREKEHTGWTWTRVAVGRAASGGQPDQLTGVALVLLRKTPVLPLALAYCPRGFVLDWADAPTLEVLLREVCRVAKSRGATLLRLDPAVAVGDGPTREALQQKGFVRTDPGDDPAKTLAQPALRMVTDITDLDALHQELPQGTRWSIRKSSKSGLVYESVGRDQIATFHDLLTVTGARDGFGVRSLEYFTTLYDLLHPSDDITISLVRLDPEQAIAAAAGQRAESAGQLTKLLAKLDKYPEQAQKLARQRETLEQSIANAEQQIAEFTALRESSPSGPYLAGSVFATCGTRGSYLYAASADDYRTLRPNYLMVWTLMQRAAAKGVTSFDFGGIDASEGLKEFKRQWNPQRREYVGEFTLRLRPLAGRLVELLVAAYKRR